MAKIIFYILFACFVIYGAAWFSRQPNFQIVSVEISGNASVGTLDIKEIVNRNISGYYFFLFPRSNQFIYPEEAIKGELLSKFLEISSVKFTLKDQKVHIYIDERVPAYLWCQGLPEEKKTDCYFMDKDGYIFSKAPNFSLAGQAGNAYFTYYGMVSAENPLGLAYLDSKQFSLLNRFQVELDKNGIKTISENSKDDGTREFYLARGGRIIFKNTQDVDMLAGALSLIKSKTNVLSGNSETLDYMDMRFGNKVYYKLVGDNAVQSSQ